MIACTSEGCMYGLCGFYSCVRVVYRCEGFIYVAELYTGVRIWYMYVRELYTDVRIWYMYVGELYTGVRVLCMWEFYACVRVVFRYEGFIHVESCTQVWGFYTCGELYTPQQYAYGSVVHRCEAFMHVGELYTGVRMLYISENFIHVWELYTSVRVLCMWESCVQVWGFYTCGRVVYRCDGLSELQLNIPMSGMSYYDDGANFASPRRINIEHSKKYFQKGRLSSTLALLNHAVLAEYMQVETNWLLSQPHMFNPIALCFTP